MRDFAGRSSCGGGLRIPRQRATVRLEQERATVYDVHQKCELQDSL